MTEYSEDEFDRLAAERTTQGAHRRPGFKHAWLLALLAVVILAPILGIWLGNSYSNRNGGSEPVAGAETSTAAETASADATDDASSHAEDTASDERAEGDMSAEASDGATGDDGDTETTNDATESADPEADINFDAQVLLLNGRGVVGWAGENRDILEQADYTSVEVADYAGGGNPPETTVYYASADLEATANDIADELDATTLVESADAVAGNDIVVVLR